MYDNGRLVEDLGLGIEVKMRRLGGGPRSLSQPSPTPATDPPQPFFSPPLFLFLNGVEMMENIVY
jgi:hypothetical protein